MVLMSHSASPVPQGGAHGGMQACRNPAVAATASTFTGLKRQAAQCRSYPIFYASTIMSDGISLGAVPSSHPTLQRTSD